MSISKSKPSSKVVPVFTVKTDNLMFRTKHAMLMTLSRLLIKHTSIYDYVNTEHNIAGSNMSPWP